MAERRNNPVSVRLSGGERGALDALAAEHGVGASTMARTLIVQALAARSGVQSTSGADGIDSPDAGEAGMRAVDLTWAREGVEAAVESALRRTLAPGLLVPADLADPVPGSGLRKVPRGYSYADHLPYDTPESLDELQGPTSGKVRVPPPIDTSLDPTYELSDPGQLRWLYTRVLREGNVAQQREYIDGKTLSRLWGELELPARCRAIWEAKFPMLRGSVVPR